MQDLIPHGETFAAPLDVHLDAENVVQPDLLWVAENSRCVVRDGRLHGAPDLVVEILSPSTTRIDRTDKFLLYERFGVSEYWIIDPTHKLLEVWTLRDGLYAQHGVYGTGEIFHSPALGREVNLSVVFGQ